MFDRVSCPSCHKMITEGDVVQDVPWDDAFACATIYFNCPHCGTRLEVHVNVEWYFTIAQNGEVKNGLQ